ncbi:MAG: YraN family protein [Longimicrobiaceae bacterium]
MDTEGPLRPPRRATKPLGDRGEEIAARHLAERGWTVLDRNYRLGRKEIDLVARRGETVAFVEVKTRGGRGYGHPLEAITWKKRREIGQVAQAWIDRHGCNGDVYRFDAVAVLVGGGGEPVVEHVEDAWRM